LLTLPYDGNGTPWAGGGESAELLNTISGLARFQASYSGTPVDSVYPYLTSIQGTWAATCAVSALIERQRSGSGQTVEVSGLHAVNVFGGSVYARAEAEHTIVSQMASLPERRPTVRPSPGFSGTLSGSQ